MSFRRKRCATSQTRLNVFLFVLVFLEEKVVLGEPPFDDVHALTGSLKLYFRELPEPLIPYDFFSGFVTAISKSTTLLKLIDKVSWGLFLDIPENISGPKSQLSNCNPLVLKS